MAIRIQNEEFKFALTHGTNSIYPSDGRICMWTLKADGCLEVTGKFVVPLFVKFIKFIEHDEHSFILMLSNDTKHAFYQIAPVRNPSAIVELLETALTAFNKLEATDADPERTAELADDLGDKLDAHHVPKELCHSIARSGANHWREQYCAIKQQKVQTYDGNTIIIRRDGEHIELQLIEQSGRTTTWNVAAHTSVLFPYITDRDCMLAAVIEGETKCCVCQSLESLAKVIEDPATVTNWRQCVIEPPTLNGHPFSLMSTGFKTGFTQPWLRARRFINVETALSCGLSVAESMFSEIEPCTRRFPELSNQLAMRIGSVYVCRSSGAIFMGNHAILIDATVTRISRNMFVIGGYGFPVSGRPLVDAIADYAYSTPDIGEHPSPPIETVIQRLVYFKYGRLEVLTVFPGGVITWVTSVADLSDERQFEHDFPDFTLVTDPRKRTYYLHGALSLFYYGNTLAVLYEDRIDIYLNLVSILSVLDGDVQPAIIKPNYYVEFAGMYLAMRARCNSKPPIFVYASGAVSYSMTHLNVAVNEEIISHTPTRVSLSDSPTVRAIEWHSERPCSHRSALVPETNIYKNTIEF